MSNSVNAISRGKTPARTVLILAWPIILEQLLLTLTVNVDTAMVSVLGAGATAAIAVNQSVINLINAVLMAFGVGLTALVARNIGAENYARARKVIVQGAILGLVMGAVSTVIMCALSPQIPVWMGAEPEILADARNYLLIISMANFPKAFSVLFTAVLRGMGDTKAPMRINFLVNFVNIGGNFFFIYPTRVITLGGLAFTMIGFDWGVAGAAASTSLSILAGGVMMTLALFRRQGEMRIRRSDGMGPDREILSSIIRISMPATGERLAMSFGQIAQTFMVTSLGTVALASHHLAATAESLCFMPPFGFSAAVTTLVGQALGAGEEDLAETFAKETAKMAITFMTISSVLLFVFARYLMMIFSNDPIVIQQGMTCLRIVAFSEPFLALNLSMFGALRGAGDTKWPFYITFFSMWGVRILPGLVLVLFFGFGLYTVWVLMAIDIVTKSILATMRFRTGKWKHALKHESVETSQSEPVTE